MKCSRTLGRQPDARRRLLPRALHARPRPPPSQAERGADRPRPHLHGASGPAGGGNSANYQIKAWVLKRTGGYGPRHLNEREFEVTKAALTNGNRTVHLHIPAIELTWGMEIQYQLTDAEGSAFEGKLHNSIHALPQDAASAATQ